METLCVLGDELSAGFGDARHLGWLGRVLARTALPCPTFVASLPIAGETTTSLAARWRLETSIRWDPEAGRRMVLAPGAHDVNAGLSLARSRLNLANVLDSAAQDGVRSLVVGPAPTLSTDRRRVGNLSAAFRDVCERRSVRYVDTFTPLQANEQWLADLGTTDGTHPTQVGYGLLAWLVLHNGWYEWLGASEAA